MSKNRLVLPEGRVSYPALFEPKDNFSKTSKEFSVQISWPKTQDLTDFRKALLEAMREKYGADQATKWPVQFRKRDMMQYLSETGQDGWPLRDGDVSGRPELDGCVYATFKSPADRRPKVVDHNVQPILDSSEIYGGCYARVSVKAYASDKCGSGKGGVSASLGNVQKTKDGEAFGAGNVRPEDDFGPVDNNDEEEF